MKKKQLIPALFLVSIFTSPVTYAFDYNSILDRLKNVFSGDIVPPPNSSSKQSTVTQRSGDIVPPPKKG